ncbi:MAG TPA: hypothetical protein VKE88_02435, partial [Candidatus Nanoarchaeia archaeon]|nr:hypothetical protein [Candidatus Nanoarchaeia archaeon]
QKDTAELTARFAQFDTTIQYENPTRERLRELAYAEVVRELKREIYDQTEKGMKGISPGIARKEVKEISDLAYQQAEPLFKPIAYAEIDKNLSKLQEDLVREMSKRAGGRSVHYAQNSAESKPAKAAPGKSEAKKPAAKKKKFSMDD